MKAYIIGSGIAGLAAAIRLRALDYDVVVFESNETAGGKIGELVQGGFRFDTGPSLLTLPQLVDELFTLCGREPREYFRYHRLDILCHYFYPDGTFLRTFSDEEKLAEELYANTGEPRENILRYLKQSRRLYELTRPVFLESSLHRINTYFTASAWKSFFNLHRLDSFVSLHRRNESSFRSDKIVQLFDRYATYNGSNPYLAPATLKVIPHLEYHLGAFFPEKGIYEIIQSLFKLAQEIGVKFRFKTRVTRLVTHGKKISAIETEQEGKKETIEEGAIVVSNMDVVNTYRRLMPGQPAPENILGQPRSTSALVFYWGIKKQFSSLSLHNLFFSGDYRQEFDFLTHRKKIFHDPTVYLHISSKQKPDDAPPGCENWFVMINAPHVAGQQWNELIHEARKNILQKLCSQLNEPIEPLIISESILDPEKIEAQTASYLGALYGSSSNNRMAAFFRHKNFSSRYRNLYFCGGSVHPGGGIPLCLLSAKIVAELIKKRN